MITRLANGPLGGLALLLATLLLCALPGLLERLLTALGG